MMKKLEPSHPVHSPWFELEPGDGFNWSPQQEDTYDGTASGGVCGPSSAMTHVARAGCLVSLFLCIFHLLYSVTLQRGQNLTLIKIGLFLWIGWTEMGIKLSDPFSHLSSLPERTYHQMLGPVARLPRVARSMMSVHGLSWHG